MEHTRHLILVGGGSGAGKTHFVQGFSQATLLSTDNFYRGKSHMQPPYNFDSPDSIDGKRLIQSVKQLLQGESVTIPVFDPMVSEVVGEREVSPERFIVLEGIFALHFSALRKLATLSVFLEVPESERIKRRIERDCVEKGRDLVATLEYSMHVEREHQRWVAPQKLYADLVL